MKPIKLLIAMALGAAITSCSSGNRDEQASDTSTMDTSMMDTSMNDRLDTTGVADTAGTDSMYRNSPARTDTKSGNSGK